MAYICSPIRGNGVWRSWLAHLVWDQRVLCSSHSTATKKRDVFQRLFFCRGTGCGAPHTSMPRGSAPIIPRGSAFRICLWQIHGSRRRADARGLSLLRAVFVEIRACRACASPSQPQSAALTAPFRGKRPAPSAPAGGSAASTSDRKSR